MLNQMIKWTVLIGLWRNYKRHFSITLLMLLALLLITLFHQDFVEYNEKSATPYLAVSYIVKWIAYLLCAGVYVFAIKRVNRLSKYDSTLHSMMKEKSKETSNNESTEANEGEKATSDPFERLRNKKSLRSKADFIIDNDKK